MLHLACIDSRQSKRKQSVVDSGEIVCQVADS